MKTIQMESNIFERIMAVCPDKEIEVCCIKLSKMSRLTSAAAARSLIDLAYRLFALGYTDEALTVCECSHIDAPKAGKVNYDVWSVILCIWGLEAYIYHKQGNEEKCAERIAEIDRIHSIPVGEYDTEEKMRSHNRELYSSLTYEDVIRSDEIEFELMAGNKKRINKLIFSALHEMIGYGATGFYPHLEEHREELEKMIEYYIKLLQ